MSSYQQTPRLLLNQLLYLLTFFKLSCLLYSLCFVHISDSTNASCASASLLCDKDSNHVAKYNSCG